jgi:TctA family transporter
MLLGWLLEAGPAGAVVGVLAFTSNSKPALEENLRRTVLISRGSFMIFVQRPFPALFLLIALMIVAGAFWPDKSRCGRTS